MTIAFETLVHALVSDLFSEFQKTKGPSELPKDTKVDIPIPGYSKEVVSLSVLDNVLVISLKGETFRKFPLSKEIDISLVKASVKNGMLTIRVEKKKQEIMQIAID